MILNKECHSEITMTRQLYEILKNNPGIIVCDIPLRCPKCDSGMFSFATSRTFWRIDRKTYNLCRSCDYEISANDFKRRLLTQ